MRLRLRAVQGALDRLEGIIEAEDAATVQAFRAEFSATLDPETLIRLSREAHAGNPEVVPEIAELVEAEATYVAARGRGESTPAHVRAARDPRRAATTG